MEPQAVKPDWISSIARLGAASVRRSFATTIQETHNPETTKHKERRPNNMALMYKLYKMQRTFKDGRTDTANGKWYARAVKLGTYDTAYIIPPYPHGLACNGWA